MNSTRPDLGRVVMPLVKVLRDADLSWTCREDIAAAILACWRNWDSMQQEQAKLQSSGAQCARSLDQHGPVLRHQDGSKL